MLDASRLAPDHIGPKLLSPKPVTVIAVVDGEIIAPPEYVNGLSSANTWLDHTYPDAGQAAFYKAEKLAEHPALISGGLYGSCGELAFVARRASS